MDHTYYICSQRPDIKPMEVRWDFIPTAQISAYRWLDNGYHPHAEAQLTYLPAYGFLLRMTCREQEPRAVYRQYNDPVYTDSCLEFFAAWADGISIGGDRRDTRYMNMEMNANGALLSAIGTGRELRVPVRTVTGGDIPQVEATVCPQDWSVTALIPLRVLERLYGISAETFKPGYRFHGNFYKCGDETPQPHYGMWSPVLTEKPDFHRPEYFGELVML